MAIRAGSTLHLRFVTPSGTADLQAKYRTAALKSANKLIDATSGADEWERFISGIKNWDLSFEGVYNGASSPLGSADLVTFMALSSGTVTISPMGTTTGSIRYVGAFWTENVEQDMPYDELLTIKLTIKGSGALTVSTW
jgi:predicted secreted protein